MDTAQRLPENEKANIDTVRSAAYKGQPSVALFAGRVGGNQQYIAEEDPRLLKKVPDAAPLSRLSEFINPTGFLQRELWRAAIIEGLGTFLLIFLLGAMASGLTSLPQSPFAQILYVALVDSIGLSLFTYCLGPVSGAHLNPTITMATLFAGLSTLPRATLYIVSQSVGAIIAGYWLRLGLGHDGYFPKDVIPGCTVEANVSPGQLFALESAFCLALIFIAFGTGLDPRQGNVLGPAFAPALVGISLGLGNLASSLAKPGYTGMSFNPARCLGLMTAKPDMQYHYIHWLAPLLAAGVNGIAYCLVPPWPSGSLFVKRVREEGA